MNVEEAGAGVWSTRRRLSFDLPVSAESLRTDNTLLTSGVAYPKAFHDKLGPFDVALGNSWDWFIRVSETYPLLPLQPPAVLISWRGSNTSRDPNEPQRAALLQRLREKQDLGELISKNHFTVLSPGK